MSDAGTSGTAAGTGTGTATGTGQATGQTDQWFTGYEPEILGHIQNRGWDKLPAKDAIAQAVKAHREAEKLIGVPAEQILRLPKDINDKAALSTIYERLGAPKDAKDYDFSGVKFADGSEPEGEFLETVRGLAAKYHLSKDDAKGLAADLVKQIETDEGSETAAYQTKLDGEREALKQNWGANYNVNMIVARNAFAKLMEGKDKATADAAMASLEKAVGYNTLMEMFRDIGSRIGEDKFVRSDGTAGGALTKEQAQAQLKDLQNDQAWVAKFMKGDAEAKRQFDNLTALIAGG